MARTHTVQCGGLNRDSASGDSLQISFHWLMYPVVTSASIWLLEPMHMHMSVNSIYGNNIVVYIKCNQLCVYLG